MADNKIIHSKIIEEKQQTQETRKYLYEKLEKAYKVPVISFFTSFRHPVMIENADADMLENLLLKEDLSRGFVLLISSPGGDGLAAERIVNLCRSYSDTGEFDVLVAGKAKSAATMICLGSSKIIMSQSAELGPIDPQFVEVDENGMPSQVFSAYNLIMSYKKIFEKAVQTDGKMQPYLQALDKYDPRQIQQFISEIELSEDIAVKSLKTGMLKNLSEEKIKKAIKIFLIPERTKVHGRPIYYQDAQSCGLNIELIEKNNKLWPTIYELYYRLNTYVSSNKSKCIESKKQSFFTSVPKREE